MINSLALSLKRRKTPPCSKGIETDSVADTDVESNGRKTPPCSKGIETDD